MASIESAFQAATDANQINGAIICATNSDHSFTYTTALGQRTLLSGEQRPQALDDILSLASATKLITTIAALQCIEDGLLSMAGDLSHLIPELTSKRVLTSFDDTPHLEATTSPITLQQLLTHSAGTSYHFGVPKLSKWNEKFNPPNPGHQMSVEEAWAYPLDYQPGQGWMYGGALDWVGRIIERATNKTLLQVMRERIFTPLNITDAEFYPLPDHLRARHVDTNPSDPLGTGIAVVGEAARAAPLLKGHFGGHGIYMSAQDYIRILHSLLSNDGKLLTPESADAMFRDHLSPEATAMHQAVILDPRAAPLFRAGVDAPTKVGHGLGGIVALEGVPGYFGKGTLAWGGGNTLAWFVDRENDICGVGAVQAKVDTAYEIVDALKRTFRWDVYRKYGEWRNRA